MIEETVIKRHEALYFGVFVAGTAGVNIIESDT